MWPDEDPLAAAVADEDAFSESDNDASPTHGAHAACIIDDPEVWMDYYADDLLDLWYGLKERCASRGFAILDACEFPDFAQFCFQFSSGYPPPV